MLLFPTYIYIYKFARLHTPPPSSTGLSGILYQSNQNGFNDPIGNKNIICTMMKYRETIYIHHTPLNTSCREVNPVFPLVLPLESGFFGYVLLFLSCFTSLLVLKPISSSCLSMSWASGISFIMTFLGYPVGFSFFYVDIFKNYFPYHGKAAFHDCGSCEHNFTLCFKAFSSPCLSVTWESLFHYCILYLGIFSCVCLFYIYVLIAYSRILIARTSMARLPWLIQTRFRVPRKFFR